MIDTPKELPEIGKITSAVALTSTLLLCMSAIYSTAYFYVVGQEFQDLMSAQDYITESIYWIILTLVGVSIVVVIDIVQREPVSLAGQRLREKKSEGIRAESDHPVSCS